MPKRDSQSDSNMEEEVGDDMYGILETSPKTKIARVEEWNSLNDRHLEALNSIQNGHPTAEWVDNTITQHTAATIMAMRDLESGERELNNGHVADPMKDEKVSEGEDSFSKSTNADDDEEDCRNVDTQPLSRGSLSPSSSLSSTERVFRNSESIRRDSSIMEERLRQIDLARVLLLPEDTREELKKCLQNEQFVIRLRDFMGNDFKSQMLSRGADLESPSCSSVLNFVRTSDQTTLCGIVGYTFVTDYVAHNQGSSNTLDESQLVGNSTYVPGDTKFTNVENGNVGLHPNNILAPVDSAESVIIDEGQYSIPTIPEVPNFDETKPFVADINPIPDIQVSTDVWERAFDYVHSGSKVRVKKMGTVLFDAVFTEDEIRNCTISGNKGKKQFDANKIRFIKSGFLWLKTEPETRTQEAFKSRQTQQPNRSDEADLHHLQRSVFTEYAYSRRRSLLLLDAQSQS